MEDSGAGGAAGAAGAASDTRDPEAKVVVVRCPAAQVATECTLQGEGAELVVSGDVIAPGTLYLGGAVRVGGDGTIDCVGCECGADSGARVLRCADSVVAPAFVNPHDHVAYADEPPRAASAERYEHRHDWRLGLRGHARLMFDGGASAAVRAAHELRLVLGGGTTVAGGAGHRGLARNPDLPGLGEGLPSAPADSDTFPLDDASGLLLSASCRYGSDHTESGDVARYGGYLPHLGEGIDAEAENELRCALGAELDLVQENTAVVHAVAATAADALELGRRHAAVVWSPRSNLSLYGNTAQVPLLLRSGVDVSLGTDWLLSGSMNLLRELACARSFAAEYFAGALDDVDLFQMATAAGARAVGAGRALGQLAPGFFADLTLIHARGRAPHTAVVSAEPADIELVLRGGVPLYGRATLIEGLAGSSCEALDVCGAAQRACTAETGFTLAELVAAAGDYPLVSCEAPPNEPTCTPARGDEYDGSARSDDSDGDAVPDAVDLCPDWFDPVRPMDAGRQPDSDADGLGDACDPCPLDADRDCAGRTIGDRDGDGIPDGRDVCPDRADPEQPDQDTDKIGDLCDFCPSANPGARFCPLPVAALRDRTRGDHPPRHALVELPFAQVSALRPDSGGSRGYYIEEAPLPFSGIFVYTGDASPGVTRGERVTLRGRYDEYYGSDQLVLLELVARVAGDTELAPIRVTASDIADGGPLAAALEQLLVRVENVRVLDPNPDAPSDYDEFLLAGGLRVDDLLHPELTNDFPAETRFSSLTGVLGHSFDHQKLWPRDAFDLVP